MTTCTDASWARQVWAEPSDDKHVRCMLLCPEPPASPWVVLALGIGLGAWTICGVVGVVQIARWLLGV
jgi:hypothetical protein